MYIYTYGFPEIGYPQIIHFNRMVHDKPSVLGYPHVWKPPILTGPYSIFSISAFPQRQVLPEDAEKDKLECNLPGVWGALCDTM